MIKLELNRIPTLCITWAEANKTHDTLTDGCSFFVQTMEPVDKLLQCVDPCKDRELWVRENKTGEIRPVDVEIWPQRCLTALHMHTFTPPQLTLKQRLQPEAWLKSAGIFTPPTDPLVTPNRLGDDQSALTGSSHPHISLLRTRAVFGEFSEWRWSDEWRCQVAAGCSFLSAETAQENWNHECELWGEWSRSINGELWTRVNVE